jgi:hypothetical protein
MKIAKEALLILEYEDSNRSIQLTDTGLNAMFASLISHQLAVLFSQNKPVTSNQPAILFSQNKPAPAISHQPTEQAESMEITRNSTWPITEKARCDVAFNMYSQKRPILWQLEKISVSISFVLQHNRDILLKHLKQR